MILLSLRFLAISPRTPTHHRNKDFYFSANCLFSLRFVHWRKYCPNECLNAPLNRTLLGEKGGGLSRFRRLPGDCMWVWFPLLAASTAAQMAASATRFSQKDGGAVEEATARAGNAAHTAPAAQLAPGIGTGPNRTVMDLRPGVGPQPGDPQGTVQGRRNGRPGRSKN